MLTPAFALRQRAMWEKRLGAGVNGSRFAGAAEVKCRVDGKTILLPPCVDAGPGDRITVGGSVFLLKDVQRMRDFRGHVSHIEGELA